MRRRSRADADVVRRAFSLLALVAALACAGAALAAERYQTRYTAADQAAARAAVVRTADLGKPAGWSGGRTKPDLTADEACADFRPKRSDLVVTGAAASEFRHRGGLSVHSEVGILATPAMVSLDWQRSVANPRLVPCLRRTFAREMQGQNVDLVSVGRVPFPRLAPRTAAFRIVMKARGQAGARVVVDFVALARGRSEVSLVVGGPDADRAAVVSLEKRLARLLVSRLPR